LKVSAPDDNPQTCILIRGHLKICLSAREYNLQVLFSLGYEIPARRRRETRSEEGGRLLGLRRTYSERASCGKEFFSHRKSLAYSFVGHGIPPPRKVISQKIFSYSWDSTFQTENPLENALLELLLFL